MGSILIAIWGSLAGRMVTYGLASILLYVVLRFLVPRATRRSRFELDDVVVGAIRSPLAFVLFSAGVLTSLEMARLPSRIASLLHTALCVALLLSIAALIIRLLRRVVSRYAEVRARQSESNLDDVLVPLLCKRVIPLLVWISVGVVLLGLVGVRWESLLTVMGGLSFLLIFLFQEPLSNLFSGVYLVIDVPFKYGDLLILEDGNTYRVEEIGTRVTKLYNTGNHTLAYVPNNSLAGQRLVNLTRPNVELRQKISIGIAYETEQETIQEVPELLQTIANSHPHVLGDPHEKSGAMTRKLDSMPAGNARSRLEAELARVQCEALIRSRTEELIRRVELLRIVANQFERSGLDPEEREVMEKELAWIWREFASVRRELTVWLHHVGRLDAAYGQDSVLQSWSLANLDTAISSSEQAEIWRLNCTPPDQVARELEDASRLALIGTFPDAEQEFLYVSQPMWLDVLRGLRSDPDAIKPGTVETWIGQQPSWTSYEDFRKLHANWHKPVRDLMGRLSAIGESSKWRAEREFEVDRQLGLVVELLRERFLLAPPGWQAPSADFVGFGAASLDFTLEFFVDDLVGEHFSRLDDTLSEIGLEILATFKRREIDIPYPQMDIRFRDAWLEQACLRPAGNQANPGVDAKDPEE